MSDPVLHYRAHVLRLGREVDAEAAYATLVGDRAPAFWLDSASAETGRGRFSFLGDAAGPLAEVLRHDVGAGDEPVFDRLRRELSRRVVDAPGLPFDFVGGFVGYAGYEVKSECGSPNAREAATPDAVWIFADRIVAVDHASDETYLVALSLDSATAAEAERWLARTRSVLADLASLGEPPLDADTTDVEDALAHPRGDYLASIESGLEHLRSGESYEICLTNEARIPGEAHTWEVYRRLRRLNPAPYAAYLSFGDVTIACSSPERFLTVERGGTVWSTPIKGTAPRAADPGDDDRIRTELAADEKMRAENLMIVDLTRNDLGRVCELGSVEVPVLFGVETYATVHQLVSTVRGTLRPGVDAVDCVRACFPGGSMTGAPKLRTMEIIGELEDRPRGVYSGSIGYLSLTGAADLNIVIRTMVHDGAGWRIGAGGAIVLDSEPEAEFDEMVLKARACARALW